MMMMMDTTSESDYKKKMTCIHCCGLLPPFANDNNFKCSSSKMSSTTALSSIFKLNFLKAFDTLEWLEEEELTLLCSNCNDLLTNLYQMYEDFLQVGNIESVLSITLARLNEIVDCHQQKSINCDLIKNTSREKNEKISTPQSPPQSSSSSKLHPLTMEPTVRLTRISDESGNLSTTTRHENVEEIDSDEDYSVPSDADDDNYSETSEIKLETDDDNSSDSSENKLETDDEVQSSSAIESEDEEDDDEKSLEPVTTGGVGKTRKITKTKKYSSKTISLSSKDKKSAEKTIHSKRKGSQHSKNNNNKILRARSKSSYLELKSKFANPCWYCNRTDFSAPTDCWEHTNQEHIPKIESSKETVCSRCSRICDDSDSITIHLKWCNLIPTGDIVAMGFQCKCCSKRFTTHHSLNQHLLRIHTNDEGQLVPPGVKVSRAKPFVCEVCSKGFPEQRRLQKHMECHQDDKPFLCERCDFRGKSLHSLRQHGKSQHDANEKVQCDVCNLFYKNEHYLKVHKKRRHTTHVMNDEGQLVSVEEFKKSRLKKFLCEICSKSFAVNGNLKRHMLSHTDNRPFPCDQCEFKAKSNNALRKHKSFQHQDIQKVKCDVCGSLHKNKHAMHIHKRVMHTAEGYQKYREQQEANLERLREKHKANPVSTFCVDCNVDFHHILGLINHRRTVHADNMGREFICESCGKDFASKCSLKDHMEKVHSDNRPFTCNICGKSFKRERTLKTHTDQSHTEEGRLKYNQKMREWSQRRRLLASQLAAVRRE